MKKLLLSSLVAAALLLGGTAVPAPLGQSDAHAEGANNAIAINSRDGSYVFRVAFTIRRDNTTFVSDSNLALASASCSNCETVAVAIDVVLVTTDPSTVTPTNVAVASNSYCDLCDTYANAYQYVYGTGGQVRLTPEGYREIASIRQQLEAMRTSPMPLDEVDQQVNVLIAELEQVIATQLVPAGAPSAPAPASPASAASPAPQVASGAR